MNVDEDEITAGGASVHRQAMVLRQNNRFNGQRGHNNGGVRLHEFRLIKSRKYLISFYIYVLILSILLTLTFICY